MVKSVSIIIPTLNEASVIGYALDSVWSLVDVEIIVSDGGSEDDTVRIARRFSGGGMRKVIVVEGPRGRGRQLAAGAAVARGEILVFLHADNQLSTNFVEQLERAGWPPWGAFRQRIDEPRWRYRLLEWGNALRVRLMGRVFGDQAMFVRRDLYEQVGGFARVSLMEDVMISRQLRAVRWPRLLAGPVVVSARRWQRRGVLRQTWLNWRIQFAFLCGTTPDELSKRYG
jgi:rSAM/selenodomain-associated transferase 2